MSFFHHWECNLCHNRVYAGRQLLADFRCFQCWLTSSNQQLSKAALQLLSELPIAMEIERGLLTLCGTAGVDETDSCVTSTGLAKGHQLVLLPSQNFPVLNEVAWNTAKDWEECVV